MSLSARRFFVLAVLVASAGAAPAFAIDFLLPFKRIEADPKKAYRLSEEHGPWLIVAASFFGEHGEHQAHKLALELRSEYKLPAYVYKKDFDYGKRLPGRGIDKYGRPKKMRHLHSAQFQEVAVLVGDYDSFDDSKAQKDLKKIKYAKPKSLVFRPVTRDEAVFLDPRVDGAQQTSQRMSGWRFAKHLLSRDEDDKSKGPMGSAFVTRNPLLPADYFAKGPDKFVMNLNKNVEFSLLDCPGNYSVRVASFRAFSTWDKRHIEAAASGKAVKSNLVEAAEKAHKLTTALRKQGIEAYEFHDRSESIVTVGSFDAVGQRRRDGKIEINPEIHQIMRTYAPKQQNLGGVSTGLRPRSIAGITFDIQPLPVQVPRKPGSQFSAMRTRR